MVWLGANYRLDVVCSATLFASKCTVGAFFLFSIVRLHEHEHDIGQI